MKKSRIAMGSTFSKGILCLSVQGCIIAAGVYLTFLLFEYLNQKPWGLQSLMDEFNKFAFVTIAINNSILLLLNILDFSKTDIGHVATLAVMGVQSGCIYLHFFDCSNYKKVK